MPYKVFKINDKYRVYKTDPDGKRQGKTLGTHDLEAEALSQIRAINISEHSVSTKGGEGSGHWGHTGRPGEIGGSAPSEGGGGSSGDRPTGVAGERSYAKFEKGQDVPQDARDRVARWSGVRGIVARDALNKADRGEIGIMTVRRRDEKSGRDLPVGIIGLRKDVIGRGGTKYMGLTHVSTRDRGYARHAMFEVLRQAATQGLGVKVVAHPDAFSFFRKIGMKQGEGVASNTFTWPPPSRRKEKDVMEGQQEKADGAADPTSGEPTSGNFVAAEMTVDMITQDMIPAAVKELDEEKQRLWVETYVTAFNESWDEIEAEAKANEAVGLPAPDVTEVVEEPEDIAEVVEPEDEEKKEAGVVSTEMLLSSIGGDDMTPGLYVFKQANEVEGPTRWFTISSGGFQDRDKEIVTTDFLRSCVKAADESGERGPLRLYHVAGADVGTCDFQAVVAKEGEPGFLLESGLFADTEFGRAARDFDWSAEKMGTSIRFLYGRRTDDGQYLPPGMIVERSILPLDAAAFPWSGLALKEVGVKTQAPTIDARKRDFLVKILGEERTNQIVERLPLFADELKQLVRAKEAEVEQEQVGEEPEVTVKEASDESFTVVLTDDAVKAIADSVSEVIKAQLQLMATAPVTKEAAEPEGDAPASASLADVLERLDALATRVNDIYDELVGAGSKAARTPPEEPTSKKTEAVASFPDIAKAQIYRATKATTAASDTNAVVPVDLEEVAKKTLGLK
jgi:hypothetical protein